MFSGHLKKLNLLNPSTINYLNAIPAFYNLNKFIYSDLKIS